MTFEIGTDPSHVEQHPRNGTGECALADRFGEFAIADDNTLDTDREVAADSVHTTVQALQRGDEQPVVDRGNERVKVTLTGTDRQ